MQIRLQYPPDSGRNRCEKKLTGQVLRISLIMILGMTAYESLKQLISPGITVWESHIVTIIFSTTIAAITSFIFLRKYIELNGHLNAKRLESLRLQNELNVTVKKLQGTLSAVKTLSGMLPVCSSCRKIRDDDGHWDRIEVYIMKHTNVDFSHGLCPDCAHDLYPEIFDKPNVA